MSNGYYVVSLAESEDRYVIVRECWGDRAPDYQRTIEVTDGEASLYITRKQLAIVFDHLRGYFDGVIPMEFAE